MSKKCHPLVYFLALTVLFSEKAICTMQRDCIIGVILDSNISRVSKEEIVAIKLAIDDVLSLRNLTLILQTRYTDRDGIQAAMAATNLINTQKVEVILGPRTWEETSIVAKIASQAHIPILSFLDLPKSAIDQWPHLIQFTPNNYAQMNAIASIVQSFEWHQITVIYEDYPSFSGSIPHLSVAMRENGLEINNFIAISSFSSSSSLSEELVKLKQGESRVFVVHLSFPMAVRLFKFASEMEMMEKDYVWITTDSFTNLVHSFNSSMISTMQGILGIKSFIRENSNSFHEFRKNFNRNFRLEYPEEDNREPGIFAIRAHDAIWTIVEGMMKMKDVGKNLLQGIESSNFYGISGNIQFLNQKISPASTFQIVNVIGKSYRDIGFWSYKLGFSESVDGGVVYNSSMKSLGQVFWPGMAWSIPSGWAVPMNGNSLKIGVPMNGNSLKIGVPSESSFKEYVKVRHDLNGNKSYFEGFAVELFEEAVKLIPYHFPYYFVPFSGSYDDIVEQVHLKKFDAVVGDVAIVARRYEHAEFTHPYAESGLVMIVPVKSSSKRALLFMKPFTGSMWVLILAINIYNGFVVWLIERNYCSELKGPFLNQIGTMLSLSFTTLFSLHGEKLHSNLSRMAMVVWLFVALVITQTYTANLTSILTVQKLEPTITNIESLQNSNAMVGYCRGSFVARYLEEVLHFNRRNIRNYSSPQEYAHALQSQEIQAAFLEVPFAKLFVAKYCNLFTTSGPTYKVGGFGFVFPRGSTLLPDVTEALLKVSEHGKLRELEIKMLSAQRCSDKESNDAIPSLSPNSFWLLFILTGSISTFALLIYFFRLIWNLNESMFGRKAIWSLMLVVIKHWKPQRRTFSRRLSDAEISTNYSSRQDFSIRI